MISWTWLDGLQHPFAQVAGAAVPQFQGLVLAGGRPRGHHGLGAQAVVQPEFGQHGGLAPGVQDFLGADGFDVGHMSSFRGKWLRLRREPWSMRSPSPGRNKAQAPPGKGQDLGLSDVSWRRGDYGCSGFFGSSFFAG